MHDVKDDPAQRGMLESLGNGTDNAEPERLPEPHGGVIRFHNGVELHPGVSLIASLRKRVLAERASDSSASRIALYINRRKNADCFQYGARSI